LKIIKEISEYVILMGLLYVHKPLYHNYKNRPLRASATLRVKWQISLHYIRSTLPVITQHTKHLQDLSNYDSVFVATKG